MSSPPFRFKQFSVAHDKCAMKVNTDGVLLGAWADVDEARTILDIGTGTGVIALMMAQRTIGAFIYAIDIDKDARDSASHKGIKIIDGSSNELVKNAIKKSYCVVTATGVKDLLSNYYALTENDFGSSLLTNMGADDEYGNNFSDERVLFSKKTFNFCIDSPTAMRYLDPVFYAHNYSIDIILSNKVKNGYNPFPIESALQVLEDWAWTHEEDLPNWRKYY